MSLLVPEQPEPVPWLAQQPQPPVLSTRVRRSFLFFSTEKQTKRKEKIHCLWGGTPLVPCERALLLFRS